MKKIILSLFYFGLVATVAAQPDSIQAPYKRFPTFPPITLLLPDGVSLFTKNSLPKNSAVLLMLFSPECSHCKEETENIVTHIAEFKDIQIVMVTPMPFESMLAFREKYGLAKHKNITVAQDNKVMLPTFFMINNLPYLAFYNTKKELIDTFEGSMSVENMLEKFKK